MKKKTPNEPQEGEDEDETFLVMITLNGVMKKVSAKNLLASKEMEESDCFGRRRQVETVFSRQMVIPF